MPIEYLGATPKQYWKQFLTPQEYSSLTPQGAMLARYWTQWLPKMCREMKDNGTLYQTLKEEGNRLADLMQDLIQKNNYPEDGALEIIKEQIYSMPPEK